MSYFGSCSSICFHTDAHAALLPNALLVEVIFGVPGKDCNGVGICRITSIDHVRVNWKCPRAIAWLNITNEGGLVLAFERSLLLPAVQERFFRAPFFQVEGPYSMPPTLLSELNLKSLTLKIGQYPIKVSEKFFVINF
jgi:hypothetical protein